MGRLLSMVAIAMIAATACSSGGTGNVAAPDLAQRAGENRAEQTTTVPLAQQPDTTTTTDAPTTTTGERKTPPSAVVPWATGGDATDSDASDDASADAADGASADATDTDQDPDADSADTTTSEPPADDDVEDDKNATPAVPLEPVSPASSCPGEPVGAGAHSPRTELIDLDGDGADDEVIIYYYPTSGMWHLRTARASGAIQDVPIDGSDRTDRAMVLGIRDVNDDGRPELFVDVGRSGNMDTIGIYALSGCGPSRVLSEAGTPAVIEVGVDDRTLRGLSCEGSSQIDVFEAERFETSAWTGRLRTHDLVGKVLVARPGRQPLFSDSQLERSASINCPPVRLRS